MASEVEELRALAKELAERTCETCGEPLPSLRRTICPVCRMAAASGGVVRVHQPVVRRPRRTPEETLAAALADMRGPTASRPWGRKKRKQGYQPDGSLGPVKRPFGW